MVQSHPEGIVLHLHIQPGASGTGIAGMYGDALKIRLQAPPVDGKANKALSAFLSNLFGVPPSRIDILKGKTGRRKSALIRGLDTAAARDILAPFLDS